MHHLSVKEFFGCSPKLPSAATLDKLALAVGHKKTNYTTPTNVGIEVEIENIDSAGTSLWKCAEDHSLKDHGYEYITAPLHGTYLLAALDDLEKNILTNGCKFSHRCSMHVHINVSKLSVTQLYTLIATYIATENLFFSLVRDDRAGNTYCWPLADGFLKKSDIIAEKLNEHYKYAALNPHHLVDYGTLEFRHHGGTKDTKEILNWIETILQLYKYVEKYTPETINKVIKNLNSDSNYFEFCIDVFGPKFQQFAGLPLYRYMRAPVTAAKYFLE